MAELGNVFSGEAEPERLADFTFLQQYAQLFVADLRAFLKRNAVRTCEHHARDVQRHVRRGLFSGRDREVESPAAISRRFEAEIANVLPGLFHNPAMIIPASMLQCSRLLYFVA